MSTSLKVAETIVRIIIIVVQILGITGGGLLIRLIPNTSSDTVISVAYGIGGTTIGISGLIIIYELLMIFLAFIEKVHAARLVVDIVISVLMSCLCASAAVTAIAFAIILFLFILLVRNLGLLFPLPIVFGILASTVFCVSGLSFGMIYSRITNQSRAGASQSAAVIERTPTTQSDACSDPCGTYSTVGKGDSPQYNHPTAGSIGEDSYYAEALNKAKVTVTSQAAAVIETTPTTQSEVAQQLTSIPQALNDAGSDPPVSYSTVGEGDSPQYSHPTAGGIGEDSYYAEALNKAKVTVASQSAAVIETTSEGDSPQFNHATAGDSFKDSHYAEALNNENVTITVDDNQIGRDELPSYEPIIA